MCTQGLILENGVQCELKRFGPDSQMERGFVGRILGTFAVFSGKGDLQRDFGTLSRFRVDLSRKADFIPDWEMEMAGTSFICTTSVHSG